ncbi:hypothetical protein BJP39_19260 [Streptomyces sp. CC77]|nr:hypothetical protein BJP39_19260 [Streptomyces sp. CC77]
MRPRVAAIRRSEAARVSSPTNAAGPSGRYVIRTGCTGTAASSAAWKAAGRKRPWARPHHVEPSGKTTTREPASRAAAAARTKPGRARSRSRSRKRVPPRAASGPSRGQ